MDIKTLLFNLREEVSCSVCTDPFIDPKQLPCLHSFCLHCLNGLLRTSHRHDAITCPICQRVSRVPASGNLNDLPTSFYLNSMLDALAIKECNTSNVKCSNCDKKSSETSYCFQCCSFWCNDCITGHNIIRANKDHRVLALKDFQDEDFEDVLKRPTFCQKKHHEKEELKFFCKNCEVALCHTCVPTLHSGHVIVPLKQAADERKLEVASLIETKQRKAQEKNDRIIELDEQCTKVQQQVANVKSDVEKFAEKMFEVIQAKKEQIFTAVENRAKESLERLGREKNEVGNEVKMIETAVEKTQTLLKRSTSAEIVRLNKSFETMLDQVEQEEQVDRDPEGLHFTFRENQKIFDALNTEGIGIVSDTKDTQARESSAEGKGLHEAVVGLEAQIVVTTRNAEGRKYYNELDRVTVEVNNREGRDCVYEKRIKHDKEGLYAISYFMKEAGNCEAVVKVNGEHVRGSPCAVQVKSRVFRPVLAFGQDGSSVGMFKGPWGVAVNDRDEIAVTDQFNQRVQIYSCDGNHLRSFGRQGSGEGEFKFPTGIVFSHNNNIVVADSDNHRIQMFSERGEYVRQFGGKGNLNHQLSDPRGLSVDSDGNLFVADAGNKLIKIFSPNSEFLQKICGEGSFTFPIHCVQYDRYLIVSYHSDQCIKVFDREGNFLYKFGKKGEGDGEFNHPSCLSVTKSGHLMVCDTNNHRVQVFELSGKFLTKFGTQGNNIGEFKLPFSVAALSDGRIVVSDYLNHRIQIFE